MPRSYALSDAGRSTRDAQKQQTRDALLNAARVLFSERGYDNVSVTEIGRRAGVSHTLINAYFEGKAGLLYALVRESNGPQIAATRQIVEGEGSIAERLRRVLQLWADRDLSEPRLLAVMQANSWVWSAEAEAENRAERDGALALLAGMLEGVELQRITPAQTIEAVFAIYTWGLRDAVFLALPPAAAVERLWPQVEALLAGA